MPNAKAATTLLHLSRWSAAVRLAFTGALIVTSAVALTAWLVVRQVEAAMTNRAVSSVGVNLRLARELLRLQGGEGPVRLEGGKLLAANGLLLDGDDALVDQVRQIAGGTATIFRGDLRVSTNVLKPDNTRAIGTHLARGPVYDAIFKNGQTYYGSADILGTNYFTAYDPLKDAQGRIVGILYVGTKKTEYLSLIRNLQRTAALSGLMLILSGGAALFFAVRRTFRPLDALRNTMVELAGGKLDAPVPALDRADEIGRMAEAMQVFKDQALAARKAEERELIERLAEETRATRLAELVQSFESRIGSLVGIVASAAAELQVTADSMNTTAEQTNRHATEVTTAAQQTTAGVQAVAAAADELTASVGEITRQVAQSAYRSGQAADDARRTNEVVRKLSESAMRIGNVIGLISTIAGQTNLLALNATIEAARAGDGGKGFAVVALEVKSLAQQTARATEEIGMQVGHVQAAIQEAVEAIGGVTQAVAELSSIASAIAAAVEEQGAATAEIARNAEGAASGTKQVTSIMAGVTQGAGKTGAAAAQVLGAASELSREAKELFTEIGRFVMDVKAAA